MMIRCIRCETGFLRLGPNQRYCPPCVVPHTREYNRDYSKKPRAQKTKKTINSAPKNKHYVLRHILKKENVPVDDLLWRFQFYRALVADQTCHYCQGTLNIFGSGLDALDNSQGHRCYNVVPCCGACNRIKGAHISYARMMELAPILREWRKIDSANLL
jgi:hypothetical protein